MDVLAQFDVLVPTFQKLAANTGAGDLDRSTPCEGWAVRDVLDHMIGGATQFSAVVRGQAAGPVPATTAESLAAMTAAAVADIDDAFRAPGALERTLDTPFGTMPGETFARLVVLDGLVHSWDLATATGQDLDVPDELVAAVDGFARAAITPELRVPGVFGPEVEPQPDATPIERLVAFCGRQA
ncbi:MAG TPA: TIGR03086 family metal-binding protein [Acidimicrobiales bacterium]|nr:TIGR03086 family metal-binding protein [Acidimicrobiales bacterium]